MTERASAGTTRFHHRPCCPGHRAPGPALAHPVAGVRFAAVQAGVRKANRYDLLLAQFDEGTAVGGVFTQNRFAAAPVQVCREQHWLAGNSCAGGEHRDRQRGNRRTLTNAKASCAVWPRHSASLPIRCCRFPGVIAEHPADGSTSTRASMQRQRPRSRPTGSRRGIAWRRPS